MLRDSWRELNTAIEEGGVLRSQVLTRCSLGEEGGVVVPAVSLRGTRPVIGALSNSERSGADAQRIVARTRHCC